VQQSEGGATPAGGEFASRPPNYLARAVILTLLLVPLGLLIGASKFVEALNILFGPAYRSEVPGWMTALMAMLAGIAGFMGIIMPIVALAKSLQVNGRFDGGDRLGAESASKRAAYYSKQSIIFLIALLLILFADVFRYLTAS
jgi:hypothetical protein